MDIQVIPAPTTDGVYCADCRYQWEVICPDAIGIRWECLQAPLGVDPETVSFNNQFGFVTDVIFPVAGTGYQIVPVCLRAKS